MTEWVVMVELNINPSPIVILNLFQDLFELFILNELNKTRSDEDDMAIAAIKGTTLPEIA